MSVLRHKRPIGLDGIAERQRRGYPLIHLITRTVVYTTLAGIVLFVVLEVLRFS